MCKIGFDITAGQQFFFGHSLKCSDRFPWWGWHYRPQEKAFSTRRCKKMWVSEAFQHEPNTLPTSKHWTSQSLQAKSKSGGDTLSSPNNTILMQVSHLVGKFILFPLVRLRLDRTAVSIFVVMLVELTNTVFVNSTNITTNIETAVLSKSEYSWF